MATQVATSTSPSLTRAIGPVAATLLVVGSIIGSGIFLTTGVMAQVLPSPVLLLAAWAVGGLFALFGALTYAELGTMFPRAGGVYVYLVEAFGQLAGFLYGWSMLLVVLSGGIAAVAVGFASYLSYFLPSLSPGYALFTIPLGQAGWTLTADKAVAVMMIVVLGAINYRGVRAGSGTIAVATVAKVAGLALIVIFAATSGRSLPSLTPIVPVSIDSPMVAFGVALIAVLWANDGFYFLTFAAGEVRDPTRNLPRAMTYGLLAVLAIYLSVNVAYLIALPMNDLAGTSRVAERAVSALVGPSGAAMVALTVVLSTFGCDAAAILAASRLLYAMASDGLFFRAAAAIHPKYRTPHVALVGITIWSSLLALSGSYEQLFTYAVFTSVLFSVLGGLALFKLRFSRPAADRPYRVWLYPVVPGVFVLGSLLVVLNTLFARPVQSIAGLSLLALGLPAYFYWRRAAVPAPSST